MIVRCSVCGNSAASDKSGEAHICRVCGSSALWETDDVFEDNRAASCELCGNPLDIKAGEHYKCAVCGFEGTVAAEARSDSRSQADSAFLAEENSAPDTAARINNVIPLSKTDRGVETASFSLPSDSAVKPSESDFRDTDGLSSTKAGIYSNAEIIPSEEGVSVHKNASGTKRKIEPDILDDEDYFEKSEENMRELLKPLPVQEKTSESKQTEVTDNTSPEKNSVHMNAEVLKPNIDNTERISSGDKRRPSSNTNVASATNMSACSSDINERIKSAETGFDKIFIVPAPLGKARTADPDISFLMRGREGKEVRFCAPLINLSDGNTDIAVFNAVQYYIKPQNVPLKDAFAAFKYENREKLCGLTVLPYNLDEDAALADEFKCDFIELNLTDFLLPGIPENNAAKLITEARGIISRRGYNLYLIARLGAITSADLIKTLCLGADACSSGVASAEFIEELKEYCTLCAHRAIGEFSRSDLKFT